MKRPVAVLYRHRTTHLVSCSVCLRVLRGSEWVDAQEIIRELRSYELDAPPRLKAAVCESCADEIVERRMVPEEAIAA